MHMIQYAFVGDTMVPRTEDMPDEQVIQEAKRLSCGLAGNRQPERYDRCPDCEAWTMVGGLLRTHLDCPAVRAKKESNEDARGV